MTIHGPDSNGNYWVTNDAGERQGSFNSRYDAQRWIANQLPKRGGRRPIKGHTTDRGGNHWWFR